MWLNDAFERCPYYKSDVNDVWDNVGEISTHNRGCFAVHYVASHQKTIKNVYHLTGALQRRLWNTDCRGAPQLYWTRQSHVVDADEQRHCPLVKRLTRKIARWVVQKLIPVNCTQINVQRKASRGPGQSYRGRASIVAQFLVILFYPFLCFYPTTLSKRAWPFVSSQCGLVQFVKQARLLILLEWVVTRETC